MKDAVLGIDGALGPFSVALRSRGGSFPPRGLTGRGNDALERGLDLLNDVLGDLALAQLERIVVTTGPGSFTGLRIAAAYAKSLAFAAGVPLVGVGSFDVLDGERDAGDLEPGGASQRLAVIPSRAGHLNARLRVPGRPQLGWGGPVERVVAAIAEAVAPGSRLRVAGAPAGVLAALAERDIDVYSVSLPVPFALAVAACGSLRPPLASPHALVADYGEDGPPTVAPAEPRG